MPATVDTAELVAEWGAYYVNEKQNMASLIQNVRQKTATPSYAKPAITENTVFRQSETQLGEIIQAFQKAFTPKGILKFVPKEIPLYQIKIDHALYPDEVVESWAGFLGDLTKNERAAWPLIRYLLEQEVIPQMHQDLELRGYYNGVKVNPTPGTAGTASGSMNGLKVWLDAGLTDGSINDLSTIGTVTSSNIFDKVEEIADQLQEALLGEMIIMAMNPTKKRQYLRDKRNTHGTDVNYDEKKTTVDFYDNLMIVGLPSMIGKDDIWVTPKRNFRYVRRSNGMKPIKVEELKREVFLMTDWWEGVGFDINEMVYYYQADSSGSGS